MDSTRCPRCLKSASISSNRLIIEKCGHIKCRECFISDLKDCIDCLKESRKSPDDAGQQKSNISPEPDDSNFKNIFDTDSNCGDLCIDTERDDSSTEPFPIYRAKNEQTFIATDPSNDNILQIPEGKTEKVNILEELIIVPARTKVENLSHEISPVNAAVRRKTTKRVSADHIVKSVENGITYYICNFCNNRFRSKTQQYYHLYCGNEDKKPHKCKICPKRFSTTSHLNYHMLTHTDTKKYPCNLCSKVFLRNISLQIHMKMHQGIFKFNCKNCNLRFNERSSFVAHMNKHENIFPFVCKTCGKKFSLKSNLTQHQVTHSGGRKRFRCEDCGKEFGRNNSYKEHLIRHTKVKGFPCEICLKSFIDRKTLGRHMKTHGGCQIYICPCCNVKSARKDNLVRHLRNMHPKENLKELMEKITVLSSSNDNQNIENSCSIPETEQDDLQSSYAHNTKNVVSTVLQGVDHIHDNQHQIVVSSSVIRSIGNVKPVQIPNDCDIDISFKQNDQPSQNSASQNTPTTSPVNKKLKKKYDPCEIYRKILFASNDCDDSVLGTEEFYSDLKDEHIGCCKPESEENGSSNRNENIEQSNFTEMHWRKRTSQYFYTAL